MVTLVARTITNKASTAKWALNRLPKVELETRLTQPLFRSHATTATADELRPASTSHFFFLPTVSSTPSPEPS